MPEDNRRRAYDLAREKFDVPYSFEDFSKQLDDTANVRQLHEALSEHYEMSPLDEFTKKMGLNPSPSVAPPVAARPVQKPDPNSEFVGRTMPTVMPKTVAEDDSLPLFGVSSTRNMSPVAEEVMQRNAQAIAATTAQPNKPIAPDTGEFANDHPVPYLEKVDSVGKAIDVVHATQRDYGKELAELDRLEAAMQKDPAVAPEYRALVEKNQDVLRPYYEAQKTLSETDDETIHKATYSGDRGQRLITEELAGVEKMISQVKKEEKSNLADVYKEDFKASVSRGKRIGQFSRLNAAKEILGNAQLSSDINGAFKYAAMNWEKLLPYLGHAEQVAEDFPIIDARAKKRAGLPMDASEEELLKADELAGNVESNKERTLANVAVSGALTSIPYALEMGGLDPVAMKGKAISRLLMQGIKAPSVVKRVAATALGQTLSSIANVPMFAAKVSELERQDVEGTRSLMTQIVPNAFLHNAAAYVSEVMGGPIDKWAGKLSERLFGKWAVKTEAALLRKGATKATALQVVRDGLAAARKAGHVGNFLGEVSEEEFNALFDDIIDGNEFQAPLFTTAGNQRLLEEAASIGLMMSVPGAINYAAKAQLEGQNASSVDRVGQDVPHTEFADLPKLDTDTGRPAGEAAATTDAATDGTSSVGKTPPRSGQDGSGAGELSTYNQLINTLKKHEGKVDRTSIAALVPEIAKKSRAEQLEESAGLIQQLRDDGIIDQEGNINGERLSSYEQKVPERQGKAQTQETGDGGPKVQSKEDARKLRQELKYKKEATAAGVAFNGVRADGEPLYTLKEEGIETTFTPEKGETVADAKARVTEKMVTGKAVRALAEKIARGETDFTPEELQLQKNHAADLESTLNALRALKPDKPVDELDNALSEFEDSFQAPQQSVVAGQTVAAAPTEPQKDAGNYKKGHVAFQGLNLSVENPVGSKRSGQDKTGKKWEQSMTADYGYIRGHIGKDKDHVDFFMGPDKESDFVYIVDQMTPDGGKSFDEHKVVFGAKTEDEAQQLYLDHYDEDWQEKQGGGISGVALTMDQFKEWLEKADKKEPARQWDVRVRAGNSIAEMEARAKTKGTTDAAVKRFQDMGGKFGELYASEEAFRGRVEAAQSGKDVENIIRAMFGRNPSEFKPGDKVFSVFSGEEFEVRPSTKSGIAKLRDAGGFDKDWNADNNAHFLPIEEKEKWFGKKQETKKEEPAKPAQPPKKPGNEVGNEDGFETKGGYPVAVDPNGNEFVIRAWATDVRFVGTNRVGGSGWEWYGFKRGGGGIWDGWVDGFEQEFGSFSEDELKENGIKLHTDPKELLGIAPPRGWQWKMAKAPRPTSARGTPTSPAPFSLDDVGKEIKPKEGSGWPASARWKLRGTTWNDTDKVWMVRTSGPTVIASQVELVEAEPKFSDELKTNDIPQGVRTLAAFADNPDFEISQDWLYTEIREKLSEYIASTEAAVVEMTQKMPFDAMTKRLQGRLELLQKLEKVVESRRPLQTDEQKPGDVYNQTKGYRVETDGNDAETALDVVNFEIEELDNEDMVEAKAVAEKMGIDLSKVPAARAIWVTRKREDARRYGHLENGDMAPSDRKLTADETKQLDAQITELDIQEGAIVLSDLGTDGVFLLLPEEKAVPHDDWESHIVKAREYAVALGIQKGKEGIWNDLPALVAAIQSHLKKKESKPTTHEEVVAPLIRAVNAVALRSRSGKILAVRDSGWFHFPPPLNHRWGIVFKETLAPEVQASIKSSGMEVHEVDTDKGVVTFVSLPDVRKDEADRALEAFQRVADAVTKPQSQKVKDSVASGPKTAGEVADETGILEPNVRRILGVGAKQGVFERVAEGVYTLKNGNETVAVVHAASAVEALPALAASGLKADMVFLDIPYDTPAVKGGNRGVRYMTITPEDFATVLDAVAKIVKNPHAPVIYMYSQAKSGLKAMQKYTDEILKRFKPVARGFYQKTYKDGSPTRNMRGDQDPTELILMLNQSGELPTVTDNDLQFTFVRPKGYTSEKPQAMLEQLIEMTTVEGSMVLDPFAGSGVTGAAAIKKGRRATLLEINPGVVESIILPRVEKALQSLPGEREVSAEEARRLLANNERIIAEEQKANQSKTATPGEAEIAVKLGAYFIQNPKEFATVSGLVDEYADSELDLSKKENAKYILENIAREYMRAKAEEDNEELVEEIDRILQSMAPTPTGVEGKDEGQAFAEGQRVVIKGYPEEAINGRHGKISKVDKLVMVSVFGGQKSTPVYSYRVRTDAGHELAAVSQAYLAEEGSPAPEVVPDPVYAGYAMSPDRLVSTIQNLRSSIRKGQERAERARKRENKDAILKDVASFDRDLKAAQQIWDEWATLHPEEAKKYVKAAPKKDTPAQQPAKKSEGAELVISKYSDNAIILTGETKKHLDRIKAFRAKHGLKGGWTPIKQGWMFPNRYRAELEKEFEAELTGKPQEVGSIDERIKQLQEQVMDVIASASLRGLDVKDPIVQEKLKPLQDKLHSMVEEAKKFDRYIGKNSEGDAVWEDPKGVRYLLNATKHPGIRVYEPVAIIPTRGGVDIGVSHSDRFLTAEEIQAKEPPKVNAFEKLLEMVEGGTAILVAGEYGLPTIHSIRNAEHLGYGVFKATKGDKSVTFDAGGMMQRLEDSKHGTVSYTALSGDVDAFGYDWEAVKKKLKELVSVADIQGLMSGDLKPSKFQQSLQEKIKKADKDLDSALDDFDNSFKGPGLASMLLPVSPESLAAGIKLVKVFVERGTYKFTEMMVVLYQKKGAPWLQEKWAALRSAYLSFWGEAEGEVSGKLTPPDVVKGLTFDDIADMVRQLELEHSAPKASNWGQFADEIVKRLEDGTPIKNTTELNKIAQAIFGEGAAAGAYTFKDLYDAAELGLNRYIAKHWKEIYQGAGLVGTQRTVVKINQLSALLPTETERTKEQDTFQQYSTPPAYAYLVNYVANIRAADIVVEPSAGVGNIGIFAKLLGASRVVVNELNDRRRTLISELPFDKVEGIDATHIGLKGNALDNEHPTVVVMNPPFSANAGKSANNPMVAANHITAALRALPAGGRLVAIVGRGMAFEDRRYVDWWKKISETNAVRANIFIDGSLYAKKGTNFDTRLLVIDKGQGAPLSTATTAGVESFEALIPLLEDIRNDRPAIQSATNTTGGTGLSDRPHIPGPTTSRPPTTTGGTGTQSSPSKPGAGGRSPRSPATPGTTRGGTQLSGDQSGDRAGADTGDTGSQEPGGSGVSVDRTPGEQTGVGDITQVDQASSEKPLTSAIFDPYTIQIKVDGAQPHPANIVESSTMAAVSIPPANYTPNLPENLIRDGLVSDIQLEAVVLAGNSHNQELPDKTRRGFFIGDGTGVGKGREISAIILDNMRQGREKAVWISANDDQLFEAAQKDWSDIGQKGDTIFRVPKLEKGIERSKGILFLGYPKLRSKFNDFEGQAHEFLNGIHGAKYPDLKGNTRIQQIVRWLGKDFDGVIAFDESHSMGNAIPVRGKRGNKKPSQMARAGIALQKLLPKARIVYVSATGATEVNNLAYGLRLGLWGEQTAFAHIHDFIQQMVEGGIAGMELIAKDLKAMGLYLARSISYHDVSYRMLEHPLSQPQLDVYNGAASAFQIVLQNIHAALDANNTSGSSKAAAMSSFWGTQQRFFNQLLLTMQLPSVIEDMHKQIDAGNAIVIQLVNTNEAATERAISSATTQNDGLTIRQQEGEYILERALEEGGPEVLGTYQTMEEAEAHRSQMAQIDFDALDISAKDMLIDWVRNSFPVIQFEDSMDDSGNVIQVPVMGPDGVTPLENPESVAMRDELIAELEANLRIPRGALDILLEEFGTDRVAEVTGRKRRIVKDKDGNTVLENRSGSAPEADAAAFQDDKKIILIFSEKGGTGASYHADLRVKNQRKRIHYVFQPGWRADKAIQGFGRTHRSNQRVAPEFVLVTTDLVAQKRFLSSIARRLDQLGALTKGQRKTASVGILGSEYNLETPQSRDAIVSMCRDLVKGLIPNLTYAQFSAETGLEFVDERDGSINYSKVPEIPQFLNRLLSLTTGTMQTVFDAFSERMAMAVEADRQAGKLDVGVEDLVAQSVQEVSRQLVYRDTKTRATTEMVRLKLTHKTELRTWADVENKLLKNPNKISEGFVKNVKSGGVFAVFKGAVRTQADGRTAEYVQLVSPTGQQYKERYEIQNGNYVQYSKEDAEARWNEVYDAAPKTRTTTQHIVTGLILPIWDKLPGDPRVMRVQTDDGKRMIGRIIDAEDVAETMRNLGLGAAEIEMDTAEVIEKIMDGARVKLNNGFELQAVRVQGERSIEIKNVRQAQYALVRKHGAIERVESSMLNRIQWYLPVGEQSARVLDAIMKAVNAKVVEIDEGPKAARMSIEALREVQKKQEEERDRNRPQHVKDAIQRGQDSRFISMMNSASQFFKGEKSDATVVARPKSPDWDIANQIAIMITGKPLIAVTGGLHVGVFYNGRIVISADVDAPIMAIVTHEALHAIERERPDLYRRLREIIETDGAMPKLEAMYSALGYKAHEIPSEAINDVIGNAALSPGFWEDIAGHDLPFAQKLLSAVESFIRETFDRVNMWVRGEKVAKELFDANRLIEEAKSIIAQFVRERDAATETQPTDEMRYVRSDIDAAESAEQRIIAAAQDVAEANEEFARALPDLPGSVQSTIMRPMEYLRKVAPAIGKAKQKVETEEAYQRAALRQEANGLYQQLFEMVKPKAERTGWERLEWVFRLRNGQDVRSFLRMSVPLAAHLNVGAVEDGEFKFAEFFMRAGLLSKKDFRAMVKADESIQIGSTVDVPNMLLTKSEAIGEADANGLEGDARKDFIATYVKNSPVKDQLIIGDFVKLEGGREGYQLHRKMTSDAQQLLYDRFAEEYPHFIWMIDYFINPDLRNNTKEVNGVRIPVFNRYSMAELMKANNPGFKELAGYTPDVAFNRSVIGLMKSITQGLRAGTRSPGRKYKTGSAREKGAVRDLVTAFALRSYQATRETARKDFLKAVLSNLRSISRTANVPKGWVAFDTGMSKVLEAIEEIGRLRFDPVPVKLSDAQAEAYDEGKALPKNAVSFDPVKKLLWILPFDEIYYRISALSGHDVFDMTEGQLEYKNFVKQANILAGRRLIMPEAMVDILTEQYATYEVQEGLIGKLRYLIRQSVQFYLLHPYTYVQNIGTNVLFTMEAATRSSIAGMLKIGKKGLGKNEDLRRAKEVLKHQLLGIGIGIRSGKLATEVRRILGIRSGKLATEVRRILPDEIFAGNTILRDAGVNVSEGAIDALSRGEIGSSLLQLTRYGNIDVRAKQRYAFAYLMARAKALASGHGLKGKDFRDAVEEYMKMPPMEDRVQAIAAANFEFLNYENSPAILEKAARNEFYRLIVTFPRFGYHFVSKQKDGLKALMTFYTGATQEEKINNLAHGITTLLYNFGLAGLMAAWFGFGDEDEARSSIGSSDKIVKNPDGSLERENIPSEYITANRVNLNETIANWLRYTGLGSSEEDFWMRVRSYPMVAMSAIGALAIQDARRHGVVEGMKTYMRSGNDLAQDFFSVGAGVKVVEKLMQGDDGKMYTDPYATGVPVAYYLTEQTLGTLIPGSRLFGEVILFYDPMYRRRTASKALNYNRSVPEQIVNAIRQESVFGLADRLFVDMGVLKSLPPAGSIETVSTTPPVFPDLDSHPESLGDRIGDFSDRGERFNLAESLYAKGLANKFTDKRGAEKFAFIPNPRVQKPSHLLIKMLGVNVRPYNRAGYKKAIGDKNEEE